jgi:hypothetical protein
VVRQAGGALYAHLCGRGLRWKVDLETERAVMAEIERHEARLMRGVDRAA